MIGWVKKMIHRFRRLIKFGVCGAINTGVHWGVFALLYHVAGWAAWLSHGVGFISGSVCGYLLNSRITFKEGKGRTRAQWAQYVGIDAVLTVTSSLLMKALEDAGWVRAGDWSVWIAEVAMTAVFALIHYFLYKYFVFRIRKEDDG